MAENKMLIIEDDADLREGLSYSFAGDGDDVGQAGTQKEGRSKRAAMISSYWTATCRTAQDLSCVKKCGNTAASRLLC